MTALELQECLAREVENITKDMIFKNPLGKIERLRAFSQSLPLEQTTEEEDSYDPFPYCIVRINSGKTVDAMSAQEIRTLLIIGIYEDGLEAQGHARILNIIQRIHERFRKNPVLGGQFVMQEKFNWSLQDEDTFPYYYGGIEVTWDTSSIRREDKYT